MHLERYRQLVRKIDAFFARVVERHGGDLRCGSGCHDCCLVRLSVTGVEAAAIREALARLEEDVRARLAARGAAPSEDRCPALEDDGSCAIYAARPLVCRSHGLPIRMRDEGGVAEVSACFRNYTERGPAAAEPDCIVDQTTLSTLLLAVDAEHAAVTGRPPGARHDLAAVLAARL